MELLHCLEINPRHSNYYSASIRNSMSLTIDAIIILLFHWQINHHDHQVTSIFIEVQLLLSIISKSWHLHINLICHLILYDRFGLTLNENAVSTWVTEDVTASSLYTRSRNHFFSNCSIIFNPYYFDYNHYHLIKSRWLVIDYSSTDHLLIDQSPPTSGDHLQR